jgi:hypothetical protein
LGGAHEITQWTLIQNDPDQIHDGVSALRFTAERESNRADVREKSIAFMGLYQVAQKRAGGWPEHPQADRAPSPQIILWNMARLASRDDELADVYFTIQPDVDQPEELRDAWEAARDEFQLLR